MVKQPDIPAGPAAEDEPAGPATDPLAAPARSEPAGPGTDPLAAPAGYEPAWPAADPSTLSWAADSPDLPAAYGTAWPAGPPPADAGQPPGQPPGPPRTGRPRRHWPTIAAALLGVAGLAIALVGVAGQVLPRRFTAAQQQQIMSWQVASRWRTWPAGKIFPASVGYQLSWTLFGGSSGLTLSARRVGIAPQSGCAAAVDPALARVLGKRGCDAALRATYTDATGTFVVTLAVVIMRGAAPAAGTLPARHGLTPGVRPVPFPATLAAGFGSRQRQLTGAVARGPYLLLYAAGYADGRQRERVSSNPYADSEMKDLGTGLARGIGKSLGALPPVPSCPGAPGC